MTGSTRQPLSMSRTEFEDSLDRHGGTLAQWPEAERRAAQSLVLSDRDAAAALALATRLDRALGALPAAPVELGYATRIAARVADRMAAPRLGRLAAAFGTTALAASLVAGFVLGTTLAPTDDASTLAALVLPDIDGGSSAGTSSGGTL